MSNLNEIGFGDFFLKGVTRRVTSMVAPNVNFVEENRDAIRDIISSAIALKDLPTRLEDRRALSNSAERLTRAINAFDRKGVWFSSKEANEIMHNLSRLKNFVAQFSGDEKRMGLMKRKHERDIVGNAVRGSRVRFAEGTTFKQFLESDK